MKDSIFYIVIFSGLLIASYFDYQSYEMDMRKDERIQIDLPRIVSEEVVV